MAVKLFVAVCCLLLTTLPLSWITNETQKQPYMDEIFHVPQAQQYCDGNFTAWDPMITTLPGLYLASLPLVQPVALVLGGGGGEVSAVCTTLMLRGVNVLFCVANFYLLYLLTRRLHRHHQDTSVVLTALALSTFPVLYFFTFLYYTDPAATFFALLTYYLALRGSNLAASLAGVAAVVCRQTNVLWVAFSAALTLAPILLRWLQLGKKQGEGEEGLCDWLVLSQTVALVAKSCRHNPRALVGLGREAARAVWSYVAVGAGFVAFVVVNGGIVVGDRSNHRPCLNFPQLLYFLLTTAAFSCVHTVTVGRARRFVSHAVGNPGRTLVFGLVAGALVAKFTFVHEYNLADNRHYSFYFLSKIVRRNAYAKYALVPAYYYAFVTVCSLLRGKDVFWKLSYLVCTAASVVPQRLVDFRYFIVPYLIFRLNMPMPSKLVLVGEVLFYFAINASTVYMYVYRPFVWANADGPQRFMW